ncbi:calcium/proton exchanger [Cladophialophora immunda]|uniref:Vacuolar calcium ion transporter n=1 Tax=Cladophialophora immunda TaxID=569365 RepID=A0A0D2CZ87_9EURO|nr:calcium/proton exchanger [Cladophialophora immunda]KIW28884.1 calcium/proton exchanger [Cladophialophora immunda]OQV11130.1 hypothetical protein CLAIMM_15018 [Cladophialophora immunda]
MAPVRRPNDDIETSSPLKTALTDDPNDYRLSILVVGRERSQRRHIKAEADVTYLTRPYPPGDDDIGFPSAQSPDNELKDTKKEGSPEQTGTSSDTYIDENTRQSEGHPVWNRTAITKEERHGLKKTHAILNSWINVLLICSPVGIAVSYAHVNPVAVFVINFIAIIPLAAVLSYVTEEIALRVGEVFSGLLNASFGNAVELVVSIIALAKDQVLIVQTSLIGSMLSNLLLVMGMCFFFGDFNRIEQAFNLTVAQTASSLLFLAVSSLIIPTAFEKWARTSNGTTGKQMATTENLKPCVAAVSRGTVVLLLIVYACYLFCQLKSHAEIYNTPGEKNKKRAVGAKFKNAVLPERMRRRSPEERERVVAEAEGEEREEPQLSVLVAALTLVISTVLIALNAEYLVNSINAIICGGAIFKNFIGLILMPIVGNAAEHATVVTVTVKDKMDLAIAVAVGRHMHGLRSILHQ